MKKIAVAALAALVCTLAYAAQVYSTFSPGGDLANASSTNTAQYLTNAAAVTSHWTGTCNNTTYLRGDGACQTPAGTATGANPSASLGLTAINGVAGTFMRSDAAPALDVSIAPTWTGLHRWNNSGTYVFGGTIDNTAGSGIVNGIGLALWGPGFVSVPSTGHYGFTSGAIGAAEDTIVTRDAANTLAQRNGTNAQTFRIYSTYTDASNYARLSIKNNSGANYNIGDESAGTGAGGYTQISSSLGALFRVSSTLGFQQHLLALTDNAYDIGAAGASRPRSIYVGTNIDAAGTVSAAALSGTHGTAPRIQWYATAGATNQKYWEAAVSGTALNFYLQSDAGTPQQNWLATTRSGNATTDVSFGNATDNPTFNFLGSGSTVFGGAVSTGNLSVGSGNYIGIGDALLLRDAAYTLAQRNGVNAQTFRIYNTYTDASNYERGFMSWGGNVLSIGAEAAGTGSQRTVRLKGGSVNIFQSAADRWSFDASTFALLAVTDNSYDIGASGATRPRTLYTGTSVQAPTFVHTGTTFTGSGCGGFSSIVGGATAGKFVVGSTGACTYTINLPTAPNGWACYLANITTTGDWTRQSGYTTTSCTLVGGPTAGDTLVFSAQAF